MIIYIYDYIYMIIYIYNEDVVGYFVEYMNNQLVI